MDSVYTWRRRDATAKIPRDLDYGETDLKGIAGQ